jgi:WD40 repeat protein
VELSAEALRRASRFRFLDPAQTFESTQTLQTALSLLAARPAYRDRPQGWLALRLSPDARYLAQVPYDGPLTIQHMADGAIVAELPPPRVGALQADGLREPVFSADGSRIAAVAQLGLAGVVWSLPDGAELFRTPGSGIVAMALSPKGQHIAAADTGGGIRVWDLDSGAELAGFRLAGAARLLRFGPKGRLLAASCSTGIPGACPDEARIALWDLTRRELVARLDHEAAVTDLAFSADGERLATTRRVGPEQQPPRRVGRVSIWETASGKRVARIEQPEQVTALELSRNGAHLLSAGRDGSATLWDAATGEQLVGFPHGAAIQGAGFVLIRDVPLVWTAGEDGLVRLWGLQDPAVERLRLPQGRALLAATVGDARLVTVTHNLRADAATDPRQYRREVRAWSLEDLAALLPLTHPHLVGGLRFSADGSRLATFDTRMPQMQFIPGDAPGRSRFEITDPGAGSLRLWDVTSRRQLAAVAHPAAVLAFDLSADGSRLASACADGRARVFDAEGNTVASRTWDGWVVNVAFDPGGRRLAVASGAPALLRGASGAAAVSLWDWEQDRELARVSGEQLFDALAFSPDGAVLAAGAWDGNVHLLQTGADRAPRVLGHDHAIRALAFSPDGRWLAVGTGGEDPKAPALRRGATVLWDLHHNSRRTLTRQASWTGAVAFSPNGSHLAAIDQDGRIGLWHLPDLREVGRLTHGAQSPEVRVRFAPDGGHLVSVVDETAKIWDVGTGREVARYRHELGSLWDAGFSPDGAWLATASTDATARLWRWRPADLVAEACRRLPATMSESEWQNLVGRQVRRRHVCARLTAEDP